MSKPTSAAISSLKPARVILCIMAISCGIAAAQPPLDEPAAQELTAYGHLDLAPQVQVPVHFALADSAKVASDRIYLADVARCDGFTVLCDESYAIDLGPSPAPGNSRRLLREDLLRTLAQEFPQADVAVTGPDAVVVLSEFQDLDNDWLVRQLQEFLDLHLAGVTHVRARVSSVRMRRPMRLRPGNYRAHFPDLHNSIGNNFDWLISLNRGASQLSVLLYAEQGSMMRSIEQVSVHAQVIVEQKVPVALNNLEPGQILEEQYFDARWVRVPRTYVSYVARIQDLVGMELRRRVATGEPINTQQIASPQAVRRGESVQLLIRSQGVEIQAQGRAMSSGAIGEDVEVEYHKTRRRLKSRVVAPGQVEVLL